jgi:hypothetical protein
MGQITWLNCRSGLVVTSRSHNIRQWNEGPDDKFTVTGAAMDWKEYAENQLNIRNPSGSSVITSVGNSSGSGSEPSSGKIGSSSSQVRFVGKLPTCLNRAGCQWVAQRVAHQVHLSIHTRLSFLQSVNSILPELRFHQATIRVCVLCSLQFRLIWNPIFSCYTLYFWL